MTKEGKALKESKTEPGTKEKPIEKRPEVSPLGQKKAEEMPIAQQVAKIVQPRVSSSAIAMPRKTANKLAVVGCSDSKDLAPFDDETYELWGVNNLFYHIKRYTRWFEIHHIAHDGKHWTRRGEREFRGQKVDDYVKGLAEMKCPVYMQKHWPEIPNSVPYPLKRVLDVFGSYFTNTISYMLALGILEGFEEIGCWGVDMAVDTEYFWQRPSCEYVIGFFNGMCHQKGLKTRLYIPPTADLLKARYLYGFQEPEEMEWRKKVKSTKIAMQQKMEKAMEQERQHHDLVKQYQGAIQATRELDKIWK